MHVSELINQLQQIQKEYGDLEIGRHEYCPSYPNQNKFYHISYILHNTTIGYDTKGNKKVMLGFVLDEKETI